MRGGKEEGEAEYEKCPNFESDKIWKCQNWKLSKSEKCPNLKVSKSESVKNWKCQNCSRSVLSTYLVLGTVSV